MYMYYYIFNTLEVSVSDISSTSTYVGNQILQLIAEVKIFLTRCDLSLMCNQISCLESRNMELNL